MILELCSCRKEICIKIILNFSGNLRIDPNPLPFKLVEITEDDEDDIQMYSKFFEAKAGFELKTHQLENWKFNFVFI